MERKSQDVKLKVVIFVSYTYPYVGSGIGNVALMQAENLAKLGHKVTIISSNLPKSKNKFRRKGVLHLKLNAVNFLEKFDVPVPLFFLNSEVANYIKNADLVHAHDMLYPSSFQAALWAKKHKKPFILTQHAGYIKYSSPAIIFLEELVRKTMGKAVLNLSEKVLVVNEEVRNWLKVDGQKVITLINGVDTTLFYPVTPLRKKELRKKYGLPLNRKIVLYVGRLVAKKGYSVLFEAKDSRYTIVFAGGGKAPRHQRPGVNGVVFLGEVSPSKINEVYQASDVFVLPSDCEGFPLSIQEAMASGLPVITTKHPGFEKYLDKRNVKFIEPSALSVKKAIIEVLSDKKLSRKMGNYSRGSAIIKTDWQENTKSLINIYKEVL